MRMLALAAMIALATPAQADAPLVKVVFMTADWCPNCEVLRPELAAAISRVEGVQRIDMDVTTPTRRAQSAEIAAANDVVAQHDKWVGRTGFAAVVDVASHRTLGCVTASYQAPEIEGALRRAVSNARNRARRPDQPIRLSDCPA